MQLATKKSCADSKKWGVPDWNEGENPTQVGPRTMVGQKDEALLKIVVTAAAVRIQRSLIGGCEQRGPVAKTGISGCYSHPSVCRH
jgi:hypothetical protein